MKRVANIFARARGWLAGVWGLNADSLTGTVVEPFDGHSVGAMLLDQIVLFPVVVVVVVSVTFLLGGKCACWQWWGSVIVTMALPFCWCRWKKSVAAGACFIGVLFVVWLVSGMSVTREWWDSHTYHFPAIRMMMLGWNPVWESTCETIGEACNQTNGFNVYQVLSMPRVVWYFSAAAAFFTKNQFDLYHPVVLFSALGTVGYVWKLLGKVGVFIKLVSVIFVVSFSQLYPHALDMTMSLAVLGLFTCHYAYLRDCKWRPLPLVCFSFWACSAKQAGILFCVISWTTFAIVILVRERKTWRGNFIRLLKYGGAIMGLFLVASVSPYITSWVHYGHPLYPQFTSDEQKFPRVNFTADFLDVNEDAKAMANRPAMFLNAFVSPDAVRRFYEWKLDKPGFRPKGETWKQGGGVGGWDTPLKSESRCWVMVPIVLMLLFGGLAERVVSIVMLLCAMAVPVEMIGLLRYVSMNQYAIVFCLPMIWRFLEKKCIAKTAFVCAVVWLAWGRLCAMARLELELLDDRLVIYDCFKRGLPTTIYYNKFVFKHNVYASLDLMKRLVPQMAKTKIEVIPDEFYKNKERSELTRVLNVEYPRFPDWSFRVPKWYGVDRLSTRKRLQMNLPKPKGAWAGALWEFSMFWRCFAVDAPRAIWLRVSGEMDNHMSRDCKKNLVSREDVCVDDSLLLLQKWGVSAAFRKYSGDRARISGKSEFRLTYPGWLKKDGAQGVMVEGSGMEGTIFLFCSGEGDIDINLMGIRVRGGMSGDIPVHADFESVKINDREMLTSPVQTSHKKQYRIPLHVTNGEVLRISLRLKPHRYDRAELRRILLDATDITFVTEGEVDDVVASPAIEPYVIE